MRKKNKKNAIINCHNNNSNHNECSSIDEDEFVVDAGASSIQHDCERWYKEWTNITIHSSRTPNDDYMNKFLNF